VSTTPTGFLGLGLMGAPMAANLARAGFPLTVWNRTPAKADAVRELGATVAARPDEAAAAAEVLVTMVADDAALEELLFGPPAVADALAPGSVVLDMSTTSPECMRSVAGRLAERDVRLVDAPVFGSTEPATTGDLSAVVGAESADLERVRPQLDAMCADVFHLGPVGAGSTMKISGNLVVLGMIGLLAESLTLGMRAGLDPGRMVEVLDAVDFTSPVFKAKGSLVVDGDYAPRFPLRHALKDVRLAQAVGAAHGIELRLASGAVEQYAAAVESGHQDDDVMAVVHVVGPRAG
jgi:3-hydroxyisobutyrate dehydrogenase-like beta-hydroxyacid dehydrogenase